MHGFSEEVKTANGDGDGGVVVMVAVVML